MNQTDFLPTPDYFIHTNDTTIRMTNPSSNLLDVRYSTSPLFEDGIPVVHAETYPVYNYAPVFVPAPASLTLGAVACVVCLVKRKRR